MDFQEVKDKIENLIEREDLDSALQMINETLNSDFHPDIQSIADSDNEISIPS